MADLVRHKLVFLGDQAVGKSSIITSFEDRRFETNYQATNGVDFFCETISHEDMCFYLRLWDTAGQERLRHLIPSYIRDSDVAIIVYDVANRQSFLNTSKWIEDVRAENGNNGFMVLVGNKADLVNERQVSTEEGDNKAREFGALFIETSAKVGFNTKALFSKIASELQRIEKLA